MTAISAAETVPVVVAVSAVTTPGITTIIASAGTAAPNAFIKGEGRFLFPGLPVSAYRLGVYCYSRHQQNQSRDNRNFLHFHTPKINLLNAMGNANGIIFPRLSCSGPAKA
jgi:hypothetical protein